jgi:hypothetical protein
VLCDCVERRRSWRSRGGLAALAPRGVHQVGRDPTPTFWDVMHRRKGGRDGPKAGFAPATSTLFRALYSLSYTGRVSAMPSTRLRSVPVERHDGAGDMAERRRLR